MRTVAITLALLAAYTLGTFSHATAANDDSARLVRAVERIAQQLERCR